MSRVFFPPLAFTLYNNLPRYRIVDDHLFLLFQEFNHPLFGLDEAGNLGGFVVEESCDSGLLGEEWQ